MTPYDLKIRLGVEKCILGAGRSAVHALKVAFASSFAFLGLRGRLAWYCWSVPSSTGRGLVGEYLKCLRPRYERDDDEEMLEARRKKRLSKFILTVPFPGKTSLHVSQRNSPLVTRISTSTHTLLPKLSSPKSRLLLTFPPFPYPLNHPTSSLPYVEKEAHRDQRSKADM
jgi:hypothetical protein